MTDKVIKIQLNTLKSFSDRILQRTFRRSHQEIHFFTIISNFTLFYLHDLEGAVGCVEELELFDGPLRNRVEGGTTPASLYQTDGLCCKHTTRKMTD